GQQKPSLTLSDADQVPVVNTRMPRSVVPRCPQPPGQAAEHCIAGESKIIVCVRMRHVSSKRRMEITSRDRFLRCDSARWIQSDYQELTLAGPDAERLSRPGPLNA